MSLTQHSTLNFTCWMSFKLVDLKVIYNWVSSAYRWYDSPWSFIMSAIGDVYNKYNKGPRTDPWGTPHFNARCEEWLFPTLTNSLREDRYDFSHLSTVPWKPKQVDSLVTRHFHMKGCAPRLVWEGGKRQLGNGVFHKEAATIFKGRAAALGCYAAQNFLPSFPSFLIRCHQWQYQIVKHWISLKRRINRWPILAMSLINYTRYL